jgi:hypothetical protein
MLVGQAEGRAAAGAFSDALEESPGSTKTRRWITSSGGDSRESATENKPPLG